RLCEGSLSHVRSRPRGQARAATGHPRRGASSRGIGRSLAARGARDGGAAYTDVDAAPRDAGLIEWLTTFNPALLTDWLKLFVAGGAALGVVGRFLSRMFKRRRARTARPESPQASAATRTRAPK